MDDSEEGGDDNLEGERDAAEPPVEVTHTGNWFLEGIVSFVNDAGGIMVSITLLVGGVVVTGKLAPAPDYFSDFGAAFASIFTGGTADGQMALRRRFDELALAHRVPRADGAPQRIGYLHLKDARVVDASGGRLPTADWPWLRVRFEEIDAWTLGELTIS